MEPFLKILHDRVWAGEIRTDAALDIALGQLSRLLAQLADDLKTEYIGPPVGLGAGQGAFCLAIRAHSEAAHERHWAVRVCSAQPHAALRAEWDLPAVSRLRKAVVVRALPMFLCGYRAAVVAAGKGGTRAGLRLASIVQALAAESGA